MNNMDKNTNETFTSDFMAEQLLAAYFNDCWTGADEQKGEYIYKTVCEYYALQHALTLEHMPNPAFHSIVALARYNEKQIRRLFYEDYL